jgi:hypothetical protein
VEWIKLHESFALSVLTTDYLTILIFQFQHYPREPDVADADFVATYVVDAIATHAVVVVLEAGGVHLPYDHFILKQIHIL